MLTRFAVAPSGFKESLSAQAAADAIAAGVRRVVPDAEVDLIPLVDGGEGTARALASATGGRLVALPATGPLGRARGHPLRAARPDRLGSAARPSWRWRRSPASPSSRTACAIRAPPPRTASAN